MPTLKKDIELKTLGCNFIIPSGSSVTLESIKNDLYFVKYFTEDKQNNIEFSFSFYVEKDLMES